ncbi:MAG: transketolase [Planctomycetes bacterium]|nr:transketolase [Planctomycetota bacterium]
MNSEDFARMIRKRVLRMACASSAAHTAGNLSAADIIAVLFVDVVGMNAEVMNDPDRHRMIFSKGHSSTVVYSALIQCGIIPESLGEQYCRDGSPLAGHVTHKLPGIEFSTGSLGHGLSIGCGLALGARLGCSPSLTYVVMGDGECNEGSVWEAVQFAGHHRLDNLILVVDANGHQAYGRTAEVLVQENLAQRFESFGWDAQMVDGHDHTVLARAFQKSPYCRPRAVVAKTVKGKGISFMEDDNIWHYRPPPVDRLNEMLAELDANGTVRH